MRSQLRLDAIVTIVDAKHLIMHLDDEKEEGVENEAVEQLAFADRVLVNKVDLVDDAELAEVERRIRAINANASLVRTTMSKVDLDWLLDVRAFDLDNVLEMDPQFLTDTDHQHDLSVTSVGIDQPGAVDLDRMNEWLGWLLREKGVDIFRMKGILNIAGEDERFVFQGVHMLFDGQPDRPWGEDEERRNRMVFIGRDLDRDEIERRFARCVVG